MLTTLGRVFPGHTSLTEVVGRFTDRPRDRFDDRVFTRVPPGEIGDWTYLGSEGIDDDGDGRTNEDGTEVVGETFTSQDMMASVCRALDIIWKRHSRVGTVAR